MKDEDKPKLTVVDRRRTGITEASPVKEPEKPKRPMTNEEVQAQILELRDKLTPRQQRMVLLRKNAEATMALIEIAMMPPPRTGEMRRPSNSEAIFQILQNQYAIIEAIWHQHAEALPYDEDYIEQQQKAEAGKEGTQGAASQEAPQDPGTDDERTRPDRDGQEGD